MNIGELISINTIEDEQSFFGDSEKHTPYRDEVRMLSCVQQGDVVQLFSALGTIDKTINTGRMSENDIVQSKYIAVSTIALATRYAIQGGLDEKTAYSFSDEAIMKIDGYENKDAIFACLGERMISLTKMVDDSRRKPKRSPYVKKCVFFINENICKKITVGEIADFCGISADYLSQIFKEEIGENLSSYILRRKTEKAKEYLISGRTMKEISSLLGFSSQAHFSTSFKKFSGMTPKEFCNISK